MSVDDFTLVAFEVFGPVFLFGPEVVEGQSAAGNVSIHFKSMCEAHFLQSCVPAVLVSLPWMSTTQHHGGLEKTELNLCWLLIPLSGGFQLDSQINR